jgi:hypothetical protein
LFKHPFLAIFQTPKLEGNRYYCIQVISKHPFCKSLKPAPFLSDPGLTRSELPEFCNFTSATVFVSSLPFITEWIPFCTSHFQCGWLYITIVGSAAFILSFMLALICNCCCCRRRRRYLIDPKSRNNNIYFLKRRKVACSDHMFPIGQFHK